MLDPKICLNQKAIPCLDQRSWGLQLQWLFCQTNLQLYNGPLDWHLIDHYSQLEKAFNLKRSHCKPSKRLAAKFSQVSDLTFHFWKSKVNLEALIVTNGHGAILLKLLLFNFSLATIVWEKSNDHKWCLWFISYDWSRRCLNSWELRLFILMIT